MADIYLGRENRWLEKRFNIKGGPTLLTLSDLTPIITLHSGAEERYLQSWNRYGLSASQAAVAAQVSAIQLRNPTGANVIAVVEKITVWGAALDQVGTVIFQNPDFGTLLTMTSARMDARGAPTPTLVGSKGSNASRLGVTTLCTVQITANGPSVDVIVTDAQEIPLAPGDSITIWSSVVNQILNASLFWRERPLETSELT